MPKSRNSSPDKWYFISKINGEKFQIYSRQGKTAESQKASETMERRGQNIELTRTTRHSILAVLLRQRRSILRSLTPGPVFRDFLGAYHLFHEIGGPVHDRVQCMVTIRSVPPWRNLSTITRATKAPMRPATSLLGILTLAQMSYSMVSFNPDIAVVVSGLVAGTLIGVVYAFPVLLALLLVSGSSALCQAP